jgi:hypothetical protein
VTLAGCADSKFHAVGQFSELKNRPSDVAPAASTGEFPQLMGSRIAHRPEVNWGISPVGMWSSLERYYCRFNNLQCKRQPGCRGSSFLQPRPSRQDRQAAQRGLTEMSVAGKGPSHGTHTHEDLHSRRAMPESEGPNWGNSPVALPRERLKVAGSSTGEFPQLPSENVHVVKGFTGLSLAYCSRVFSNYWTFPHASSPGQ